MEAYTVFADIYDEFMSNIPYEKWCENVYGILKDNDIVDGLVVELGCGTGILTTMFSDLGYEMIGVDVSEDMLAVAREDEREDILYLLQDMRELELYGTASAFISLCDSMNYLTGYDDLVEVMKKVNLYLEKDGLFIFDMKTPYCYENILGKSVQYEETEDCSLIWENYYDADSKLHTYDLTMFIQSDGSEQGELLYEKYHENHCQRAYDTEEVMNAVKEAGMEFVKMYDADTMGVPDEKTQRIYYVVKETFQENKLYV